MHETRSAGTAQTSAETSANKTDLIQSAIYVLLESSGNGLPPKSNHLVFGTRLIFQKIIKIRS